MKSESLNRPFASYIRSSAAAVPSLPFATVGVERKNRLCISPSVSRETKRQLFLQDQTWLQGVMADSSSPSFSSLVTAQVSFSQASSSAKSFYFLFMHLHLRQKYEMNHCKNMSVGLKGCNVALKNNHLKWLIEKAVILNIHLWFWRIWVLLFLIANTFADIPDKCISSCFC